MILSRFKWWRRWRGGKWALVGRMLLRSKKWIKVPDECVERVDEDYTLLGFGRTKT